MRQTLGTCGAANHLRWGQTLAGGSHWRTASHPCGRKNRVDGARVILVGLSLGAPGIEFRLPIPPKVKASAM